MTRYIPKKLRFEVLKRDGFKCRYCGAKDVALHIDHIHPYSKGGQTEFNNLGAACWECNIGKGAKPLEGEMEKEYEDGASLAADALRVDSDSVDDDETLAFVDYATEFIWFVEKEHNGVYYLKVLQGTFCGKVATFYNGQAAYQVLLLLRASQQLHRIDTMVPCDCIIEASKKRSSQADIDDIPFPPDPVEA